MRCQARARSSPSSRCGVTGTVPRPGNSIDARSGCAIKLTYQSGCRLPPPDATTSQASAPSANHVTGVSRRRLLRRPTVCRISRSIPMNLPPLRRIRAFVRAFILRCIHSDTAPGEMLLRPPRLPVRWFPATLPPPVGPSVSGQSRFRLWNVSAGHASRSRPLYVERSFSIPDRYGHSSATRHSRARRGRSRHPSGAKGRQKAARRRSLASAIAGKEPAAPRNRGPAPAVGHRTGEEPLPDRPGPRLPHRPAPAVHRSTGPRNHPIFTPVDHAGFHAFTTTPHIAMSPYARPALELVSTLPSGSTSTHRPSPRADTAGSDNRQRRPARDSRVT